MTVSKTSTPASLRTLLALAIAGSAACSDATGPASRVAGTWTYSASFFSAGNRCEVTGVRMTLGSSGGSVTGTTNGGSISCIGGPPGGPGPLQNFTVAAGRVMGDSVVFELSPVGWRNQGRLAGNTIAGTATVLASGQTGTFSAARQ